MADRVNSSIVDASGRPFALPPPPTRGLAPHRRYRADGSLPRPDGSTGVLGLPGSVFPYDASAYATQEFGDWFPTVRSPDSEINWFRDRMVARSRDLERNSGWAAGGIQRILDNCIGTHLQLQARPDYVALQRRFGVSAFDEAWADEFEEAVGSLWRGYAHDPGRWNDVERAQTMGQMMRTALRHKLIDGESCILGYWLPERTGYGSATWATAWLLVDPDRLSNPWQMIDTERMRGGCELDDLGVTVAYHFREAEQNDVFNVIQANTWKRVPREDADGFRRVIHDFDHLRANQHRGIGIFTPILGHMKMLARYYGVELQQAVLASVFGTYVESAFDPATVMDAMGADDGTGADLGGNPLPAYQDLRANWHEANPVSINGVRVPILAPGEKINSVSSAHPHTNFGDFAHEMLCVFSAASGIGIEQVTLDFSKTNYSAARAMLVEVWKTLTRRRHDFCENTATPMYGQWLEEPFVDGMLPMPTGGKAVRYREALAEFSRCNWMGPPRGWVDPVKEPQGAQTRMGAGISSLASECAEQGHDWREVMRQQKREAQLREELGLPDPVWIVQPDAKDSEGANHDPTSPNYKPND